MKRKKKAAVSDYPTLVSKIQLKKEEPLCIGDCTEDDIKNILSLDTFRVWNPMFRWMLPKRRIKHEPSQRLENALRRFDKRWHKNSENTTHTEIDLILLDVLNDTLESIGGWGKVKLSWINGPKIWTGYSDYDLSYRELTEKTDIPSILVCRQGNYKNAPKNIWHIVAYCGIVHKARMALGEYNKFVYGFMTDCVTWEFVCMDNASQVWTIKVSTLRKAMTWLRHILNSAQRASTPIATRRPFASKSNLRKNNLKNFNLFVERFRTKDGVHKDEVN
ncbi:hypothetical protein BDK51DRAFT_25695 [Blyttiomyces helicus]|uniref:Uncharacterized protein n=1 Tax=Blyttiomyces helicus TaxID=388810 RepID=A0A4P9WF62_9FUNG|nr:hypothetical protein BDK51DRAFT_25695 [Blyttiomyces helicus]|eukprot:RKO89066.1 hypothetical protein BDK51DRAFT_25695 [Blyttiomyces helicus]